MNHYLKLVACWIGIVIFILIARFTWFVLFQIPKNRIEYQKYEDNLNVVSQDIVEILQKNPEIRWIEKEPLLDEKYHYCGLRGWDSSCIQKFKLIQKVASKIPSEIWFYRCHFSKWDIFIRQRRNDVASWVHRYEFFVPFVQENLMSLRWIEYDQNTDSGYEIECYPWEEE